MIKNTFLYTYLKYLRWKYFPSATQALDKQFNPSRLSFYSQILKKGDLCFDVGANIGNRTDIFLQIGARVVAVEPQPVCTRMLKIKFGKKIELIEEALGAQQGEGVIFLSNTPELSSLSKSWINSVSGKRFKESHWEKELKIKVNTLDHLIARFGTPKFCKIDVEGYEEHVLQGLTKKIPFISFEYTVPERIESVQQCLNQLSKIGAFDCNFTVGENMKFELTEWVQPDELMKSLASMKESALFGDIYIRFKE